MPTEKTHGWHYIDFGPDKELYIAIGMPCNVCIETDPRFGSISRMNADGSHFEVFTRGLRNSVGFDWDPTSKMLWLTDNGRDWLGDDIPPDKLNYVPKKDLNFGFPYFSGKDLLDTSVEQPQILPDVTPPTAANKSKD